MADKKFTLLELHLGDGTVQIGPATIGEEQNEITEPEAKDEDESGGETGGTCPGRKAGKLLLVLVVLLVLVLGLKKAVGGGDDLDELEDLADLDGEA